MSTQAIRVSPVFGRLQALGARFAETNAMAVALTIGEADATRANRLGVADLSFLHKTGFKGPNAVAWAQSQGLEPPLVNRWDQTGEGSIISRLGETEFFVEDGRQSTLCARVIAQLQCPVEGVYPVHRNDAGLAVTGERVNELLAETCSFNFGAAQESSAVMTTMAGVTVLVIRHDFAAQPCCRIWCDPTMAAYLWDTLNEIALELGGGPVGVDAVLSAQPSA